MSNYAHRGYEQRTSGYGRRRHKASGFKRKRRGSSAAKVVAVILASAAVIALLYLFADNIMPFVKSIRGAAGEETPDSPAQTEPVETAEEPEPWAQGAYDTVDKSVFIQNGSAYTAFKGLETTARNYAAVLNSISSSMSDTVTIYNAVIPTNEAFGLKGTLEGSVPQSDNLAVIKTSLSDRVKTVDIYSALEVQKNDYIYFRTDELMTSKGAYYAYKKIAEKAGFSERSVISLSTLSEKSGSLSPFYGSFVERTMGNGQPNGNEELLESGDIVEYYKLPVHYNCYSVDPKTGNRVETDLFKEKDAISDILNIFPGKDKPLLTIENLQSETDSRLLIVKDHAAEPVIGYLVPHYSEVFVADVMLYSGSLSEYVHDNEITDILFINGIEDANNALYCQRLRDLFDNSISD